MSLRLIYPLILSLIILSTPLAAFWEEAGLEIKAAYFHPNSNRVRKIYDNDWADIQIEATQRFCQNWQAWAGISWSSKEGCSTYEHNRTRLKLYPLSLGLKYFWCINSCTELYLGAGVCYSILRIRDHSHYVHQHISKEEVGGIIQSGVQYSFCENYFADLFINYIYQRFRFPEERYTPYVRSHDLSLSGFKIGIGLGQRF